jgi:hypothetical protein
MENQTPLHQQFPDNNQIALPNATAVLVLGIIGIVGCFCYAMPGLICAVIALLLSNKDLRLYNSNPGAYTAVSLSNLKAGRVCAIIGLSLSLLFVVVAIFVIATVGFAALTDPSHFYQNIH